MGLSLTCQFVWIILPQVGMEVQHLNLKRKEISSTWICLISIMPLDQTFALLSSWLILGSTVEHLIILAQQLRVLLLMRFQGKRVSFVSHCLFSSCLFECFWYLLCETQGPLWNEQWRVGSKPRSARAFIVCYRSFYWRHKPERCYTPAINPI